MTSKAQVAGSAAMEQLRPDDRASAVPPFAVAVRHMQFSMVDAFRRMQGDALAAIGFGPVETPYRVIASDAFWRLRDYGSDHHSRSVLIVAAPIKRPYIWDLAPDVSVVSRCLGAGLRVYLLEWLPASQQTCGVGTAECSDAIATALRSIASA